MFALGFFRTGSSHCAIAQLPRIFFADCFFGAIFEDAEETSVEAPLACALPEQEDVFTKIEELKVFFLSQTKLV